MSDLFVAYYGADQKFKDVTQIVTSSFTPNPTQPHIITLPRNLDFNRYFGDPCFGKLKYLVLISFIHKAFIKIRERSIIKELTFDLTQPLPDQQSLSDNSILSATYGARNSFMDVTAIINAPESQFSTNVCI